MAQLHYLARHSCERGDLTVFEKLLPGSLKRIYYIANADGRTRAGHGHHTAWHALMCIQGSVDVLVKTAETSRLYSLDKPDQCLILEPSDWHLLENFQDTAIVLVVSNECYDELDYVYEPPNPENARNTPSEIEASRRTKRSLLTAALGVAFSLSLF